MNINVIIVMCVLLAIAVAFDLRTGKIPNHLNIGFILLGTLFNSICDGFNGFIHSMLGVSIPIVVLMILFYMKVIGAGDIKLFSGIGAFVAEDVVWVMVYSFVACSIFGIIVLLVRLIRSLAGGGMRGVFFSIMNRDFKLTKVAFSAFIIIGFGWYLVGGS